MLLNQFFRLPLQSTIVLLIITIACLSLKSLMKYLPILRLFSAGNSYKIQNKPKASDIFNKSVRNGLRKISPLDVKSTSGGNFYAKKLSANAKKCKTEMPPLLTIFSLKAMPKLKHLGFYHINIRKTHRIIIPFLQISTFNKSTKAFLKRPPKVRQFWRCISIKTLVLFSLFFLFDFIEHIVNP